VNLFGVHGESCEPGSGAWLATKAIYVLGLMAAVTGNLPNVLAGLLIAV